MPETRELVQRDFNLVETKRLLRIPKDERIISVDYDSKDRNSLRVITAKI